VSWGKLVSLVLMALFYVAAGSNHFRSPDFYLKMMPPYLSWHAQLVWLSGVAEVGLGAALLIPPLRAYAAWGIIALLIAVFPANLHVALYNVPISGEVGLGWVNWARLPIQIPLIFWAWWHTQD
jgi:uncharacterized membrane protein